ncbi:MAG: murein biosynthesis integral membrane protein MurJ [Leptospiraceae bacterium]|nr:murein biosynthesis integral membrane protein MurJ [Leptospiraceae bacterium]
MKNSNQETKKNSGSASRSIALSFYTFLSRILGLVRDHFMAVTFGTGLVASAFSVAYRFPNMFRNLLAEGTLSQSFMPIFSEAEKEGVVQAKKVAGVILTTLFSFLSIFVGLFYLAAPFFVPSLVGGSKEYSDLVIELSLILFFLIMTASLASIFMAISNSEQKFFVPSLSPIVLNLAYLIVFVFILPFYDSIEEKVRILSYGIVAGGITQLLIQAVYVAYLGFSPIYGFDFKHPAIKKIATLMIPAILGGGFYQIGLLIDIFFANYIQNQNPGLGAVVSLDYSQRLIQFPTGIIGVALATTTLPTLLNALKSDNKEIIPKELSNVISFTLFLTLPASIGFLVLGREIIDSIYYGGKWDSNSTDTTLNALRFYAFAIPAYSLNKILTSSFYAFQDTKTPLKANITAFVLNLFLNIMLIGTLKHAGLALASATCSFVTLGLLIFHFSKKYSSIEGKIILRQLFRFIPSLLVLTSCLILMKFFIGNNFFQYLYELNLSHANSSRIYVFLSIGVATLAYFFIAYLFKLEEFDIIFGRVLKRFRREK